MSLRAKLLNKDLTVGSWVTLAHPAIAEIMARAGFDWLVVDLEHSVITIREAEELIRTIDLCGVVPLVRLSANDPVLIKRVMDAGAHGVIVPMVNSVDEAQSAVESTLYPPLGKRGVGLARAQGYGTSFENYKQWLEKESVVIVQVEHINAVKNLKNILALDGVHGFIIGPYDLSGSLGVPGQFDNPRMIETMEQIKSVGAASGKACGIHIIEPDADVLKQRIGEGYRFVAYSVDIRMLESSCRSGL
ncbi:MAG: 2,4-dihydroxyhept-2-ene-1,7-dioic acid aldolase [Deltaproteobacteria bacterium]|nr:2,4-dihydroxyhept-2-ene-1,7-dioic acid aldolase [Deltaproteobacteria bacterium]MBW2343964.1 2,4-dihydroxyhept-2-ene-1,7-dioic acid aldolase [Deltaproteobacteria bacterium]